MPKPKRKSKPRSEMTAKERANARAVDKAVNAGRTTYPTFGCTQDELSALDGVWNYVNRTPTLRALILRADDRHRGREGGSGTATPIKDKHIPRSTIQRLMVRSGLYNVILHLPTSHNEQLTPINNHAHRRDLRYHLLEYLHDQFPYEANRLLAFSADNPDRLDMLLDGRLMSMLLIRPDASDLHEWSAQLSNIQDALYNFPLHIPPKGEELRPFINPYSDALNT